MTDKELYWTADMNDAPAEFKDVFLKWVSHEVEEAVKQIKENMGMYAIFERDHKNITIESFAQDFEEIHFKKRLRDVLIESVDIFDMRPIQIAEELEAIAAEFRGMK